MTQTRLTFPPSVNKSLLNQPIERKHRAVYIQGQSTPFLVSRPCFHRTHIHHSKTTR